MKKKLVLATNNKNKVKEINHILSDTNLKLIPQTYYNVSSVKENGNSFVENALLKARHASSISKLSALGDDSGLVIPSIKNEPGLYSSRYSKINVSNINKLISFLKKKKFNYIPAFYYCSIAIVFYEKDPIPIISCGKLDGFIINKKIGINGFGYDQCFFIKKHNCTIAELDIITKNKISHRAKALYSLKLQYKRI